MFFNTHQFFIGTKKAGSGKSDSSRPGRRNAMIRSTRFVVCTVAFFIVAAFIASQASAQSTRWIVATAFAESNFHTQNIRQFAEDVKQKSDGKLELAIHSGGSLVKQPELLRAVQTGQVQVSELLLFIYGSLDPFFEIDTVPFAAVGYPGARKLYALTKPYIDKRLADRGIKTLYYVAWPGQGIVSKKKIESVSDLKGTKFRTAGRTTARFAELVGASPTIVSTPEIAQAFFTGMVDLSIYSPTTAVDTKAWDYAKFFYNTLAMHSKNAVCVSQRAFDALPDDLKKVVIEAAAAAEKRGWELSEKRQYEALKELTQHGMEVVQPSDTLMSQLKDAAGKHLEEWVKEAGAEGKAVVDRLHSK
ncbi:MAG: TRAP transporter substrate-binding protein [Thermodesulfobacteriota bacterium]|nr:TRAP transporter substrate-binding protein [Thermodesulfobacteriota bacterium]